MTPAVTDRISLAEYRALLAKGATAKPKRRATPEEDLHRACFELVGALAPRYSILRWMVHYPAGGKRPKGEAGKLKAMGAKAGVPDLILPRRFGLYAGLAVEPKSPDGRLSEEQRSWLSMLAEEGYLTAVCRSLEEFQIVLMAFLKPHSPPETQRVPPLEALRWPPVQPLRCQTHQPVQTSSP